MSALDRLLCERLGIEPQIEAKHEFFDHAGDGPIPCICGATFGTSPKHERCPERAPIYPALSTTGDGMWLLMEALRVEGWDPVLTAWSKAPHAELHPGNWYATLRNPSSGGLTSKHHATAPMALALAAAAALGVEVPE